MPDGPWPAFEPYKTKVVEKIPLTTAAQRRAAAERAKYNLFLLRASEVTIDLLTDSGTAAMSDRQWGRMMVGDESYAGAESFHRLDQVVREITGMEFVLPCHQGRAAEHLLFSVLVRPGDVVPNNTHFDTTAANVGACGGVALNAPCGAAHDVKSDDPFKGNMDVERLDRALTEHAGRVPLVLMTVTNNSVGGQPVSLANIRETAAVCEAHKVPFFLDGARYAENCWFIQRREPGYIKKSLREIAHEMFGCADGALMSAKKDAFVNIGGFMALRDADLRARVAQQMVVVEGYVTYGGLAGRDLEAIAEGLGEGLDEDYMTGRIQQTTLLHRRMTELGVPCLNPPGGHAVFIDARQMVPHISQSQLPGQAVAVELYLEGGVRGSEVGSVMFARPDPQTGQLIYPDLDLIRLAIPRRVYSDNHMEHVAQTAAAVMARAAKIVGLRFTYEPARLKHFLAHFAWIK